jgi:hypothetical protein
MKEVNALKAILESQKVLAVMNIFLQMCHSIQA